MTKNYSSLRKTIVDVAEKAGVSLGTVSRVINKDVHVAPGTRERVENVMSEMGYVANRQAHVEGTGPEIWQQTGGRIDGFVCAVGTGGTLAGTAIALKERRASIRIAAADPLGAAIYSWIKTGELKAHGSSITEGIGQNRVTANLEGAPIDDAYEISDEEMLPIVFDLLEHEGLCMGGSTGINVAGAIRMAKEMGPGHTIVTILADYGTRYRSKLFNPEFLKSKDLPAPHWLAEARPPIAVPFER